jgi:hypothetical protein
LTTRKNAFAASRWRVAMGAVALILTIGATSCSDEGTSHSNTSAAASDAAGILPDPDREIPDPAPPASSDPKDRVQEAVDDIQDGLLMLRGWTICMELTEAAVEAMAGKRAGDKMTACGQAATRALHVPSMAKRRRVRSKVVSVEVHQRSAIATIRTPGRPTIRLRVVQGADGWKVPRVDLDDPTGLPADTVPTPRQ